MSEIKEYKSFNPTVKIKKSKELKVMIK